MAESGVSEGRSPYRDSGPVAMEGDSFFPIQPLVSAMPWADWIVGTIFAWVSLKPMATKVVQLALCTVGSRTYIRRRYGAIARPRASMKIRPSPPIHPRGVYPCLYSGSGKGG